MQELCELCELCGLLFNCIESDAKVGIQSDNCDTEALHTASEKAKSCYRPVLVNNNIFVDLLSACCFSANAVICQSFLPGP